MAIGLVMVIQSCDYQPSFKDPCTEFDMVDLQMLTLLDSIRTSHKGEELFLNRFRLVQVAWTQYRDRHMRSLYPEDWDRVYRKTYGRELFNSCVCKEMSRMTRNRITELNRYLEVGSEGEEECPSSMNTESS